ncbi:HNH endonuclease signature motif containing protein [Kitasatospora kifunensis]
MATNRRPLPPYSTEALELIRNGFDNGQRRARLPADWPQRRLIVLARDGYRCRAIRADTGRPCEASANQVDHIRRGDDHGYANLQALCQHHHASKTGSEGGRAASVARSRRARLRPPERHPGAL